MTAPLPPLSPEYFADSPARDERFTVVERWVDCVNLPPRHPDKENEFLHRQLNEELNVLENAARDLVEFPEVEWKLRKSLARQCADEARHTLTYLRLLKRRGVRLGQWPVMNFQYRILGRIPTLIGRLAVQNRTFEADGLDAVTFGIEQARADGDKELLAMYETQQADEVGHCRFANDWIREEAARNPASLMAMARAIDLGARAFQEIFAGGGTHESRYGVAAAERMEAGFTPAEIAVAHQQAEVRRARALETVQPGR
jgi:uncharacterized ferritin-like protein (DUF455 family)